MKDELSDFLKFAIKSGKIMTYDEFCKTEKAKEYALSKEEVKYYTSLHKNNCMKKLQNSK